MSVTNFNATTPQLKLVENFFGAILSRDLNNVRPFVTKDYTFQTFPKIASLPDEGKEEHFERYGMLLSSISKLEANAYEVIEAPGKVVVHFTAVFHTPDGDTLDYDSVCIFTLIEENGELKVVNFKDFADPVKRGKVWHGLAAKALAKSAA